MRRTSNLEASDELNFWLPPAARSGEDSNGYDRQGDLWLVFRTWSSRSSSPRTLWGATTGVARPQIRARFLVEHGSRSRIDSCTPLEMAQRQEIPAAHRATRSRSQRCRPTHIRAERWKSRGKLLTSPQIRGIFLLRITRPQELSDGLTRDLRTERPRPQVRDLVTLISRLLDLGQVRHLRQAAARRCRSCRRTSPPSAGGAPHELGDTKNGISTLASQALQVGRRWARD